MKQQWLFYQIVLACIKGVERVCARAVKRKLVVAPAAMRYECQQVKAAGVSGVLVVEHPVRTALVYEVNGGERVVIHNHLRTPPRGKKWRWCSHGCGDRIAVAVD